MIESLLLFSLGFLCAAFLAFLVAPAIQRRVVSFTENRMKATLPISPQELKAQKDMVRAEYAAQNARLSQSVVAERQRTVDAQTRAERVTAASYSLAAEKADLEQVRGELEERVRELDSALRGEESELLAMRGELAAAKQTLNEDAAKIKDMAGRLTYLAEMLDANKLALAERDEELENARSSFNSFKAERDKAREMERTADERARAAETRLSREVNKVLSLQDKLDRELAAAVRRENKLARRIEEIERMRERLKSANDQARKAVRALKNAGVAVPLGVHEPDPEPEYREEDEPDLQVVPAPALMEEPQTDNALDADALASDLHAAEAAVTEKLLQEQGPEHDEDMRAEIASIAARMVALNAVREGENSKVRSMLSGENNNSATGRLSLGERAARVLQGENS